MQINTTLINQTSMNADKLQNKSKELDKLKEQSDAYEAVIIKQMLDISMKNEDPLFGKSAGSHIYNSMRNDTIATQLSGGFGYSELLFKFLSQNI